MKIVLLGAGSLFFEGVIAEIAKTSELNGANLMLHDIDESSMRLTEQVGRRINDHYHAGLKFSASTDRTRALDGADIAIASIGVHGPRREWHFQDVKTAAKLGIMHTTGDTVGPAGLSQGLRIIPIFLDIARDMERYCPDCYLLNHSNPIGPICRAVAKTTSIPIIGYCHNVASGLGTIARVLEVESSDLDIVIAGVNHMVWLLGLRCGGKDVYPEFRERFLTAPPQATRVFTRELMELTGLYMFGGDRHIIEFFPHARIADRPDNIPYDMSWRAASAKPQDISGELNASPTTLKQRAEGLEPLLLHEGLSPEAMGLQIKALLIGPDKVHVVNVTNANAVNNLPAWALVELKSIIGLHGARPVAVGELPSVAARWTLAQIYAHELLVDAAIEGSREKAVQAFTADPMIRDFHEARNIFAALQEIHGERLARYC